MICVLCGAEAETRIETRRYDIGLDEPLTLEEVEVVHCDACGEESVGIKNVEGLHRLVAERLAQKLERLTPREIRYLRTHLGYASKDFAHALGVTVETVSRWERVAHPQPMGQTAERFLRLLVLTSRSDARYPIETMGSVAASPLHLRLHARGDGWTPVGAATA